MIPINVPAVYDKALEILKGVAGHGFRGRAAQIFLACKHYGNQIPRVGSTIGIESSQLQQLLDDLYNKPSRANPEKIAIIFDNDHKVPTGLTGGVLAVPSNIWRNNLNLQKGFVCYASVQEMQSPAFVSASRKTCPHLRPSNTTTLVQSWCHLKGEPPKYRGEDNPKMFRKDPVTGEYTVHDPQNVSFYSGIVRPASGTKIPIAALIAAIYTDSFLAAGRSHVDVADFLADFGFTSTEAAAYFDDDPASPAHQEFALSYPGMSWTRLQSTQAVQSAPPVLPGLPPVPVAQTSTPGGTVVPHPASIGVTTSPPPPAASGWWDAQQAVRKTLEAAGWLVTDTSGLKVGYDFKIIKAGTLKLIEVKSSVGICTATLTRLEYDQAIALRRDYVLAIVENFDPTSVATIQWVEDPARLQMTKRQVVQYTLPRSVWRKHTGPMP
ncbi:MULTISPECIES: DUF3883 domain-containing protein [unclassified Sphingobium]|uniref:DUF3883 domain-containing protein n=1 Tax=unclassified Sphingobium TaxID=2611147 RepID=UPI0022258AFE|nr:MULTISPECIES: DUF3883 domain-containing protein [unclassified Sphingobium]MCW2396147.1 hypothetical protein [Sphingobium sp. B8D3B]MCW2419663.1 hypothetical protein [Sphingobium sp. B8D3C]